MAPSDGKGRPMYMYDVDEQGRPIKGTQQSARKEERQKPSTTHKSRPDDKRKPKSDSGAKYGAIMSGANPEIDTKLERRKSSASSTKSPSKSHTRPPSAHANNKPFPKISIPKSDQPHHFGISPATKAAPVISQYPVMPYPVSQAPSLRPRAITAQTYPSRPVSYHASYTGSGGYGPPISSSGYFQQPIMPAPSYPPPSPSSSFMRYAATPQQDYYNNNPRPLSHRFGNVVDPIARTTSAFGVRDPPIHRQIQDAYEDGYSSASEGPRRGARASIRVPTTRSRSITRREADYDEDREAMPPPPRPGILRNRTTEYHPDTTVPDAPYRESRSTYRESSQTRRAPTSHRNSVSYDLGPETERVRVETANTGHRRQSYYGQSATTTASGSGSGGLNWEDKAREATSYQEDVSGPAIPLTAEALRRRHAGSSRSTKSSGSRDESDYRKSATTRTTRSGSGPDDDFTIKVKGGQARVMVGGAQIDCTEGGEIEIKRQKSIRNGSERSNSEYGGGGTPRIDDRRSRLDGRPSGRSRKSSVSGGGQSYMRSNPQYSVGTSYI